MLKLEPVPSPSSGEEPERPSGRRDADLVASVRAGDTEAFRLLVRRHQERLFRYGVRMTGEYDRAMDLVQGTLIRAHERLGQCRDPSRFGSWVLAILVNECRQDARRRRPEVPLDDPSFEALQSADTPVRTTERRELRSLIARALGQLVPDQREAFLLRHVEGLSYDEMAPVTGASVAALKQRVHRAREALGALLEEAR